MSGLANFFSIIVNQPTHRLDSRGFEFCVAFNRKLVDISSPALELRDRHQESGTSTCIDATITSYQAMDIHLKTDMQKDDKLVLFSSLVLSLSARRRPSSLAQKEWILLYSVNEIRVPDIVICWVACVVISILCRVLKSL